MVPGTFRPGRVPRLPVPLWWWACSLEKLHFTHVQVGSGRPGPCCGWRQQAVLGTLQPLPLLSWGSLGWCQRDSDLNFLLAGFKGDPNCSPGISVPLGRQHPDPGSFQGDRGFWKTTRVMAAWRARAGSGSPGCCGGMAWAEPQAS